MRLYLEPHTIGDDKVWGCTGMLGGSKLVLWVVEIMHGCEF